jgi:GNAT superfamily N-acetyltransferase
MRLEIEVEQVCEYSPEIAAGIGALMPDLNPQLSDQPISEDVLRKTIESADREQLIARLNGRIVGAATLNLIYGPAEGKRGWLEGFVVSSAQNVRGQGVGYKLWQEMEKWCEERSATLCFISHPERVEAHDFYDRQGAESRDTTLFIAFNEGGE